MNLLAELVKVKNKDDCEDIVSVDVYSDCELAESWLTCLSEILGDIKAIKVFGQDALLDGFDLEYENAVVAVCKLGKRKARVSLSSIEWPKLTKAQKIWITAWNDRNRF